VKFSPQLTHTLASSLLIKVIVTVLFGRLLPK